MFTKEQLSDSYQNFQGSVIVAKTAKPRPSEKTFRNNKYSIYNVGRLAARFNTSKFYATADQINA